LLEIATGLAKDVWHASLPRQPRLLRVEPGIDLSPTAPNRIALYVHYSASGVVSDMVLRQLEVYRDLGFRTVFITMSPDMPEEYWQAARCRSALAVHRRNFGLDFGAWKDVVNRALGQWPEPEELLLVNDSVLGPLRPLDPDLADMRAAGDGLFGMLESWQKGAHLQSWFLLARGRAAVDDLSGFLRTLKLSHSKWLIIRRSELRLSRYMRERGHRVAARYGYARLIEAAASRENSEYLASWRPSLANHFLPSTMHQDRVEILKALSLNPAHHLWRALLRLEFPFLKTELVRRNPGRLPGVDAWIDFVPAAAAMRLMIVSHLKFLEMRDPPIHVPGDAGADTSVVVPKSAAL
jgi:hypothetical protein